MKLGIDWVAMAILAVAYGFSRIPAVPPRVGNLGLAAACGVIAFRYYQRGLQVQFNLVMLGLACALALYYVSKAISGAGGRRRAPKSDDDVDG
ncbi:MAG: hypothetical protein IPJ65_32355 [Archangiaceae bacterium]|nr:hypothetical protein [Archangiaceae bacterium]